MKNQIICFSLNGMNEKKENYLTVLRKEEIRNQNPEFL